MSAPAADAGLSPHTAQRLPGILALGLATVIWGTTFIAIRKLVGPSTNPLPPSLLNLGRFSLATLLLCPFLQRNRQLWLGGLELGFWLWAGYATQSVGLIDTSAGRSAFITALYVVFTPALAILAGRRVPPVVVIAAVIALDGTALLCFDLNPPGRGEACTLLSAIVWSVYIIRLESRSQQFSTTSLTAVQLLVVTAFCAAWVTIEAFVAPDRSVSRAITWPVLTAVIYLGIVATALTTWLQAFGQRTVPAPQAAVLYVMEPVWAAFFAWLVSREAFAAAGWIGAAAIVFAALVSQLPEGQHAVRKN